MTTKHLPAHLEIRATGDEPEIVITTPARDLMHDTIDPMGMDCAAYLSGTRAVNFAHDHSRLPVGKTKSMTKSPQGIRVTFGWLDEANPEARAVRAVFDEGVLGASVEFMPVETEPHRDGGVHYAKTVLTGWALTGNPANVQCLRLVKSLGLGLGRGDEIFDLDAIEDAVDLGDVTPAQIRAAVEATRPWLREEAGRRARWAAMRGDEVVLTLDDEPEPDVLATLTRADVVGALREGIGGMVREAVGRQVRLARGIID